MVFKFSDDLPKEAKVLGGDAIIYGTFNCNPPNDLAQQKFRMILNDNYADEGNVLAPNTGGCWCPNCVSTIKIPVSRENFLRYYYQDDKNTVKFITQTVSGGSGSGDQEVQNDNNYICISRWSFNTHFEIPDIIVYWITPKAGPSSGGTEVRVIGLNFSQSLDMYCAFGTTLVKANYVSDKELTCKSVNTLPKLMIFRVGVKLYDEMFYSNVSFKYQAYSEVVIQDVEPETAPPNSGRKTITITGNFAETGVYKCKFSSIQWSHTKVVEGFLSQDKSQLFCVAPKWDRAETVKLSVSINGQQYSEPFYFKFAKRRISRTAEIIIIASCVAAIVVAAFALVIYCWVHHRRKTSEYERIRDGNAHAEISEISMGKRIGKGTIGEVYKGIWRGTSVAVKKINVAGMSEDTRSNFERDIRFMQDLRSPNIVQFMSCGFEGDLAYIITEYMPRGSLYNILHNTGINRKRRPNTLNMGVNAVTGWPMMVKMLTDAARGMTFLHTCRPPVVHKNLKSLNLLVDEFWGVKVCDYNLSSVSILLSERESDSTDEEFNRMKTLKRSKTMRNKRIPSRIFASWTLAPWTAPEVLEKYAYSTKSDVYSFGIIMWECLTREDPYSDISLSKLMYGVLNESLRPEVPDDAPAQYADLMRRCWAEDPESRPPFNEIIARLNEMPAKTWDGRPWGRVSAMGPLGVVAAGTSSSSSSSINSVDSSASNDLKSPRYPASVPSYSADSDSTTSEFSHLLN